MKKIPMHALHNRTELEGFIFFAERTKELLAHSVIDSFKASTLNSNTRAIELERLVRHAYDTTQRANSLLPLLDELSDSFKNDPVIVELHTKDVLLRMVNEVSTGVASDKPRLLVEAADSLRAIRVLLSEYYDTAKSILCKAVLNPKQKKLISDLAEILVIEIQSRGYSREHLRHISKTKLASRLFKSESFDVNAALDDFFSSFDSDSRTFTCAAKCHGEIDSTTAKALNLATVEKPEGFQRIDLLDIGHDEQNKELGVNFDKYLVATKVNGRDPFSARERLYGQLYMQNAIRQFLQHKSTLSFARICLVQDDQTKKEIRIAEPLNAMLLGQTSVSLTTGFEAKQQAFFEAYRNFDKKSQSSILSVISYHKEAMDSRSVVNQLVDLWAAIEGFVPQPIDASPRVSSVLDHIIPAQTLIYVEKKFIYVAEGIEQAGEEAIAIVKSIDVPGSFTKKIAALILCEEFNENVDKLMPLLDHSPLLRFRMFMLREAFATTQKAKDELLRHRTRLERQLRRIYISRNTVMHSAKVHSDIGMLVENLHSYLDIMLNAAISVAKKSRPTANINAILKLLATYETSYLDSLSKNPEKDQPLSKRTFERVFGASINPLLKEISP